jgi:uncharacterized protein YbjT (DUF2867 family)
MRLLVLGGTEFVGTAVVKDALGRGWDVTVLNRGSHPAPPGVSVLRGDRTAPGGLGGSTGRRRGGRTGRRSASTRPSRPPS